MSQIFKKNMFPEVAVDEYGTLLLTEFNANYIASRISSGKAFSAEFGVGGGTMFQMTFCHLSLARRLLDGSFTPYTGGGELFVGIERIGCFAFSAKGGDIHPNYLQEKMGRDMGTEVATNIAKFLTEIRSFLEKSYPQL